MGSLELVAAELAREPHLWWGHNAEYGWIVLDREDARNESGSRHLVRCRDWVQVEVPRVDFGSDRYQWFKNYIGALPDDQAREACSQLLVFYREFASRVGEFRITKAELECRRREAERQAIIESHRRFLEHRNLSPQNVQLPSGRSHRVTHCYNCKHHLDNAVDVECAACGWIVCRCGACGCGYQDVGAIVEY